MNINLKTTDETNNSLTKSIKIYVNDLNRAPTDIGISSPTFSETISASSTIATLSAVDSDTSDNYVFTLIAGDGSNDVDNSSFTVSGTSLIINSTANYETKSSYTIYINVNDGENNFAKTFTLSVIDRLDPIITFDDLTKVYGDANFNLTSNSSSTGSYIYNISNTNVATVTGNNVTIKGAGITTVMVIQAEDSNYNAATSSMTLTVNKAYPSINFDDLIKVFGDANFNLATTSSSTGAYDYNISNTDLASVTGNTVTIIGAGTTIVTVTQAEDSNYSSATASMSLTINKADPGIGNFNNINKIYGDSDFEIIDPSKNNLNNSNFIYSSSNPNIASISGKTISINRVGSVIISANLPADSNFNAAVVSTTLNINKSSQTISVASLPTTLPLKDFNTISLTASSTSGTPVSINLANDSAAILNGVPGNYNLQSIQQTGLVTITFYVDENSSVNYSAASVVLVVDVVKVNQNIYFNSLPNNYFNYNENLSIPIEASASSSLPLSYNLISGNASLNSKIITVTGTGQISVELNQIGNSQFNAAPPLNYTLNIGQGTTLLSGFNIPSKYKDDSPFQITPPISNRVGQIVYSSSNLQVATISADQVTILNNGQTIIKAEQITNNNYKSGTVSAVFIVNENTIVDGDNDGISDENDNCISNFNPLQNDYDNDGIGNICDDDDDNDGYNDSNDEFPLNPNEWDDYDKDGFGDNEDEDDDNDSWSDNIEISCNTDPLNNSSFPNDYDGDLIPNCIDQDYDNDGYPNDQDDFPENEFEWVDTDKDGIGDNEDEDDDGDEYNDNDEIKCDSDPLDSNSKPSDLDKDLVPNCFDLDDDNDGCLDDDDAFPLDNSECLDNDNDGIGDNSDNDDDNDGVYDFQDAFPFDSAEQKDTDGDGIGDNSDSDYNSDGLPDNVLLPSQFFSPNGDGINDTWNVINTNLFPNCEVWIYTRSGELIYNKKGYANDWTGLLNGQPIPEASYVYMVDQNGDGIIDLKGWFYLTR
jgi:gliding motility-associated-like protein